MDEEKNVTSKKSVIGNVAKIIAIVVFALVFTSLIAGIIGDIVLFSDYIKNFIAGIIIAVLVFIIGFVMLVLSCILVFGIYIIQSSGFWPITWAITVFKTILSESTVSAEQVSNFTIFRFVLLVVCIVLLLSAIASLILLKIAKKANPEQKFKPTKPFDIVSIIFSSLGILMQIGVMAVIQNI